MGMLCFLSSHSFGTFLFQKKEEEFESKLPNFIQFAVHMVLTLCFMLCTYKQLLCVQACLYLHMYVHVFVCECDISFGFSGGKCEFSNQCFPLFRFASSSIIIRSTSYVTLSYVTDRLEVLWITRLINHLPQQSHDSCFSCHVIVYHSELKKLLLSFQIDSQCRELLCFITDIYLCSTSSSE